MFSSNSNDTGDMENGEIYKMELNGKIIGKFGTAGKLLKEFGSTHELDCRIPNEIVAGEITKASAETDAAFELSGESVISLS